MKDCIGMYRYKGFTYTFSEMYQDWTAEPFLLLTKEFKEDYDNENIEMIMDEFITGQGREYIETQKTLKEMKLAITEFLKDNGKEKIINDYIKFRNNKMGN